MSSLLHLPSFLWLAGWINVSLYVIVCVCVFVCVYVFGCASVYVQLIVEACMIFVSYCAFSHTPRQHLPWHHSHRDQRRSVRGTFFMSASHLDASPVPYVVVFEGKEREREQGYTDNSWSAGNASHLRISSPKVPLLKYTDAP